jgi:hypothetical protein
LTFNVIVQLVPAASVPSASMTVVVPGIAIIVPVQVVVKPFGVEITKPAGNVSVKATPVRFTTGSGFASVRVKVVVLSSGMLTSPKLLLMVGGIATFNVAVAVFPLPTFEVTVTLFVFVPVVVAVTLTLNVQDELGRVAPARPTVPEPAVAVIVPPPHEPVSPFGVETTTPEGSVSVKPISPRDAALGLATVKLKVEVPPGAITVGEKDLLIDGGIDKTFTAAVPVLEP